MEDSGCAGGLSLFDGAGLCWAGVTIRVWCRPVPGWFMVTSVPACAGAVFGDLRADLCRVGLW